MALSEAQERLACGTPLDALVDQVAERDEPRDAAHQVGCAHCRAALVALGEAWGELQAFAAEPVVVPPGLRERIMTRIRALVERMVESAVLSGPRGRTLVSERVVRQVARRAALAVPGVVLAGGLGMTMDHADRGRVRVSLRLAIAFGPAIDALAATVRAQVSQHVSAQTGVRVAGVDIAVDDVVQDI